MVNHINGRFSRVPDYIKRNCSSNNRAYVRTFPGVYIVIHRRAIPGLWNGLRSLGAGDGNQFLLRSQTRLCDNKSQPR